MPTDSTPPLAGRTGSQHDVRLNSCFYALVWDEWIETTHKLLKVGVTKDFVQRHRHHRSGFPGWRIAFLFETEFPRETENFWKKFFRPWSYHGSPEVFLVPHEEFAFFSASVSWFSLWTQAGLNLDPEKLRLCRLELRLKDLATVCGFELANAG